MKDILSKIDHTLLKATATSDEIKKLCDEAKNFEFASVCVNPCFVELASALLKDSGVKVCTVISFPLGSDSAEDKAIAAKNAVFRGADEIDVVQNIGFAVSEKYYELKKEIEAVVNEAKNAGLKIGKTVVVKVILETCFLSDEQIVECSKASKDAGADFVKTSTGFGTGGATENAVHLMRETVGNEMGVKASGGIKTLFDAEKMIAAGASRIGTSSGVQIAGEFL